MARMRKKKNMDVRMERVAALRVLDPEQAAGSWRSLFSAGEDASLQVEIGCGKGAFILKKAMAQPEVCFVAVEKVPEALVMAMEKALAAGVTNLRFVCGDASCMADWFAPGEVDALFLNFCDPWPKKGNAKRRLTHSVFLEKYARALKPQGDLTFKTDNRGLFEFSLNEFAAFGLSMREIRFDLHASGLPNVTTEYEDKFTEEGLPIYHVIARFPGEREEKA